MYDEDELSWEAPSRFPGKPLKDLTNLETRINAESKLLNETVSVNRLDKDDPIFEVLEAVKVLRTRVDGLNNSIGMFGDSLPKQLNEVMLLQGRTIENRIGSSVCQYLQQQSKPQVDIAPIVKIINDSDRDSQVQLERQTQNLSRIALTPQKIPPLLYGIVGGLGLLSLIASAVTYKTVDDKVKVAEWVNSADGKLAKQIVIANSGLLTEQCRASTKKLKQPVVIQGIESKKVCYVAIP